MIDDDYEQYTDESKFIYAQQLQDAQRDRMKNSLKLNKDQSTAINTNVKWIPIDDPINPCPVGVKVQLINKRDGNAVHGIYNKGDTRWTHWQGVPTF